MTRHSKKPAPRRKFFGQVTAFGAAVACGSALSASAQCNSIKAETLKQHLGESFYLLGEELTLRVTLASVDAGPHDPDRPSHVRQDPFSMILHAPRDTPFKGQMCNIQHPELGSIEAFVSAVDQPSQIVKLQVVFG